VAIAVRVTSSDGSGPILRQSAAVGMSPVSVTLDLAPGHHYTLDWLATFDYGVHPCASILPGQSAFQIDT